MKYPFEVLKLPYAYDALNPFIDSRTMHLHFDKHFQGYIDKLNDVIKDYPEFHSYALEELIYFNERLPKEIQENVLYNAGGIFNHLFYFYGMKLVSEDVIQRKVFDEIDKRYGSFNNFKNMFKEACLQLKGSGYVWLVYNSSGLDIITTHNQDTVLPLETYPIFTNDMWEHAYYLKHQNRKDEYIEYWFKVINWEFADNNYKMATDIMSKGIK